MWMLYYICYHLYILSIYVINNTELLVYTKIIKIKRTLKFDFNKINSIAKFMYLFF